MKKQLIHATLFAATLTALVASAAAQYTSGYSSYNRSTGGTVTSSAVVPPGGTGGSITWATSPSGASSVTSSLTSAYGASSRTYNLPAPRTELPLLLAPVLGALEVDTLSRHIEASLAV